LSQSSLVTSFGCVQAGSQIDYGCGSGILAIAALKLGASKVYAVDIDPQAILATRENALRNAISAFIAGLVVESCFRVC